MSFCTEIYFLSFFLSVIRIHIKMKRIRNTAFYSRLYFIVFVLFCTVLFCLLEKCERSVRPGHIFSVFSVRLMTAPLLSTCTALDPSHLSDLLLQLVHHDLLLGEPDLLSLNLSYKASGLSLQSRFLILNLMNFLFNFNSDEIGNTKR